MTLASSLALALPACDGEDTGDTDPMGMETDADPDPDPDPSAGEGSELDVPASVTMAAAAGGTDPGAQLCQNLAFGGGFTYGLQAAGLSNCLGGAAYLSFARNSDSDDYRLEPGETMSEDGSMFTPVTVQSESHGMLVANEFSGDDELVGLPENTDITVTTEHHEITFRFEGDALTVTAFDSL